MPDTAVLEAQDTAAVAEAPLEIAPPETDEATAPETVDAEGTPEAEDESPAFTKADIAAAEKKAAERERAQWQKFDKERADKATAEANEAAYTRGVTSASQQAAEQRFRAAFGALNAHVKQAYDTGKEPDQQTVANLVGQLNTAAESTARYLAHDQYGRARVSAFAEEFPGYRPSVELIEAAKRAQAAFDYPTLARIDIRMAAEAARQAVTATATEQAQAEVAARAAQTPARPPARTVAPTAAGTAGGRGRNSWATITEVANAMQEGKATVADYKAAKAKGLPFS